MTAGPRVLGEVGVGADAEDVYRILLANPGLSTNELSEHTTMTSTRLRSALAQLEELAMVTRLSGTPARFQPAPPDVVVEALISSRQEALQRTLQRTRLDARELLTLRQPAPDQVKVTEIVEVLTTRSGYAQRWSQMQTATHRSLDGFVRPPFAQERIDDHEDLQSELIHRGVVVRSIYDQEALAYPGILEHVWRVVAAGEKARVVTELPIKLHISDRQMALVPLVQDDPESTVAAGLAVHRSTLLDALVALFEICWERGVGVRPGVVPAAPSADDTANHDEVIALMSSGFKDEAIARHLGVSAKTVRRRIGAVQERLGVSTRFQAGLALGRRNAKVPSDDH